MSSEWPRTTFDQLCDIKRGASPRPIHDWLAPTGIPWVKISDATASSSPFISKTAEFIRPEGAKKSVEVFPGDFILSNSATPGLPKFMQIHACVHDGWMLLRNFRGLDQWYCYYLLQTERENLIRQGNGSVFTNLKTEILKKHEVVVPPLEYQKQVATFLRTLDDRITLLRETNATLEAIAQALFKSWFVDFDPVRAKMEGRAPEGMDEATAALFPDAFEETELGVVPRGWSITTFGEFIRRLSVGKKFDQKTALSEGIVPILDQGKSGIIGYHNENPGVLASLEEPVVVFANHTCYMRLITYSFSTIQNVLPFVGKGVDTVWAFFATKGKVQFSEYKGHWPEFSIQKTFLPPFTLTEIFRSTVDPIIHSLRINEVQVESLSSLRDELLPRLISGKIII